jgi:ribosomal protein S4
MLKHYRNGPKLPYIEVDRENLKETLTSIPERTQIPLEINEGIIMEHYLRYL